jgi:hypothetical protein
MLKGQGVVERGKAMRYGVDTSEIKVGDRVIVEGNVHGQVVCDYDKRVCLPGYEQWLESRPMADGTVLASGIMVETSELGFLYYASEDVDIQKDA